MPWRSSAVILARQSAPSAQRVETVLEPVLIDHGGERADLLEVFAGRHPDAGFGAQPAPIIKPVLGDEAHAGGDVVAQPPIDLLGIEVLAVGMADREIVPAYLAFSAIGDADAAQVSAAERPAGAHIGAQPIVACLGVERDDADAAEIGSSVGGVQSLTPVSGCMRCLLGARCGPPSCA